MAGSVPPPPVLAFAICLQPSFISNSWMKDIKSDSMRMSVDILSRIDVSMWMPNFFNSNLIRFQFRAEFYRAMVTSVGSSYNFVVGLTSRILFLKYTKSLYIKTPLYSKRAYYWLRWTILLSKSRISSGYWVKMSRDKRK